MHFIKILHKEWEEMGTKLFGEDQMKWKFTCPVCGHIASMQDYKDAGAPQEEVAVSCIGRWTGIKRKLDDSGNSNGHPCDYSGYGLFKLNPVKVIFEDGKENNIFNFSETCMTNEELKKRIKKAEEKLNSYPKWVRDNCIFMGGYCSEYSNREKQ